MNYLKHYCALMRKASGRNWKKGKDPYFEKHHIFPKSIFGKNSKVVCLTAREHYIAHMLLWKGFLKRYGEKDQRTIKMAYAAWRMCFSQDSNAIHNISSKLYEELKQEISRIASNRTKSLMSDPEYKADIGMKVKNYYKNNQHPLKGKAMPESMKKKISKSTSGEKHHMWGKVGHRKGMKNKPTHCEGISNTRCEIFGNIWEVTDPDGNKYICKSLKKFAKERGLSSGHMYSLANGSLKYYRGWAVKNVKNSIV